MLLLRLFADLINFYVSLLIDPIVFNLAMLNDDIKHRNLDELSNVITTVSAFESLLSFALLQKIFTFRVRHGSCECCLF